jgi:hypothetical protein
MELDVVIYHGLKDFCLTDIPVSLHSWGITLYHKVVVSLLYLLQCA